MASTTNLNLTKLTGTEKQKTFPSPYNDNMDAIDGAFGADFGVSGKPSVNAELNSLGDGLAILANGNTHAAITSGQFVYVRGHGTLADGLYQATSNIAMNGTLSGSNLTADSAGGLNTVYSMLNSKFRQISSGSFYDIKEPGIYWLYSGVTDKPNNGAGTYILNRYNNDYLSGIYVAADNNKLYSVKYSGGVWKYTPISDIINSKIEYTTAFDVPISSTGCHFYCDRIGRTIFLSLVIYPTQAVAANTIIAHVNDISNIIEAYTSSIGSNGTGARLKLASNGKLIVEKAMPANEWFSASFVAQYNVSL